MKTIVIGMSAAALIAALSWSTAKQVAIDRVMGKMLAPAETNSLTNDVGKTLASSLLFAFAPTMRNAAEQGINSKSLAGQVCMVFEVLVLDELPGKDSC